MKKIFSLILSLAMLLTITSGLNLTAYADSSQYGNIYYEEKEDGTIEITDCTSSATSINIPSTIDGKTVTSIRNCAFYGCKSLTSVTIPNSITSIGREAFYDCTSLTSVTIPDSVTSIGDSAFYNCKSLTNVTIPNSITMIGPDTFCRCSSLENITIPASVASIGEGAFNGCKSLANVTIGNNDSAEKRSTEIGNSAFSECTSLSSVTIGNNVTSIGAAAFSDCSSLTSVTIPNSVTSIEYGTFSYCENLTSVTIPNSVTSIGDEVFYRCSSLKNITIPDSVTSIGDHAFFECKLVTLTMGNGVNYIDSCAFLNCEQLYEVNYNGTVAQWKAINVDSNNSNLTKAIIKCTDGILGNGNEVIIDNVVYNIYNDYTAQINKYPGNPEILTIPESVSYEGYAFKINSIGDYAFLECTNLKSLTMPSSVTKIGQYAFYCCTDLKDVYYLSTISDWNKIEITNTNDVLKKATIHCIDGTINEKVPTPQPQPRPQPSPTPTPTPTQPQPTTTTSTTTAPKPVLKPKSAKFKKVKAAKKAVSVEWKKVSGVKGYQIQVATDKKFKKNKKTVTVKKQKTTKVTIKKLKAKKQYYVRIRTYKTVNGKKVYSSWSKVKTVKTK